MGRATVLPLCSARRFFDGRRFLQNRLVVSDAAMRDHDIPRWWSLSATPCRDGVVQLSVEVLCMF